MCKSHPKICVCVCGGGGGGNSDYQKATLAFPCKLFYALFPRTSQLQAWIPVHGVSCGTVSTALSRLAVQSSSPHTGTLYLLVCLCKGWGDWGLVVLGRPWRNAATTSLWLEWKKKANGEKKRRVLNFKIVTKKKMWQAWRKGVCTKKGGKEARERDKNIDLSNFQVYFIVTDTHVISRAC